MRFVRNARTAGDVLVAMSREEWTRLQSGGVVRPEDDEPETYEAWSRRQIEKLSAAYTELETRVARETKWFKGHAILNNGYARLIRELEDRLDRFSSTFDEMGGRVRNIEDQYVTDAGFEDLIGRVRRLESQPIVMMTSEDGADIASLKKRVLKLEEPTPRPEEWARSVRLLERITALENGSRLVGTGDEFQRFMERLDNLEGHPRRSEQEAVNEMAAKTWAGPPIGGLTGGVIHNAGSAASKDKVRKSLLELAEGRIRTHMTGHFSEATIAGVVDALWGRKAQIVPIRDHVYQGGNEIGDTCNFTYIVEGEGWPGYRCATPEHQHLAADDVRRG